jgi:FkbM family methyltransferase
MSLYGSMRVWGRNGFDSVFCKKQSGMERLGGLSSWSIYTPRLDEDSVIYSAGVGRDISFEKELVSRFGVDIEVFDPSPTGIETMGLEENKLPNIHFNPIGIVGRSATRIFAPPKNELEGSYRIPSADGIGVEFPCADLPSLMRERGHFKIDLLKIDIEGFEYELIRDIIVNAVVINQICVEFHHFFENINIFSTMRAIVGLKRCGYDLLYKTRFDYTFALADYK